MPDRRRHRGPHPQDAELFAESQLPRLREAVTELSWLLSRGYRGTSALALVGNRHALTERQRQAVRHCACSDAALARREERRVPVVAGSLAGRAACVDGFNVLITLEAALSGAVVLSGRDGALRDLSSVHRSYRRVSETPEAIRAAGAVLAAGGASAVRWLLDRPVSNSGRLATLLRDEATAAGWTWDVELVAHPDHELAAFDGVVATSDGGVLDRCAAWCDLPGAALSSPPRSAWLLDLRS